MAYKLIERSTNAAVTAGVHGAMDEILVAGNRIDVILAPGEALPGLRLDSNAADREELDLIRAINVPGGFSRIYVDWQAFTGGLLLLRVSNDSSVEPAPVPPSRTPRYVRVSNTDPAGAELPEHISIDQGGAGLHLALFIAVLAASNPFAGDVQLQVSNDNVSWDSWKAYSPDGATGNILVVEVLEMPFRYVRAVTFAMHGTVILSARAA